MHKTFAIPHGGGGPGVGPVAVRGHLAPFLPGHPLIPDMPGHEDGIGAVASAPWGSAGVLAISWAYIALMGAGRVAPGDRGGHPQRQLHRCAPRRRTTPCSTRATTGSSLTSASSIFAASTDDTGVSNEDIAKRLIDYGFHAPTMSFPVAGTLMIEPTESESKRELDRFCDAMIAIKAEIDEVVSGAIDVDDSVLRDAPHPAENVVADRWDRSYARESAAFPVAALRADKYWPPVSRIDNAYGDRHVVCSCPPIEAYESGTDDSRTEG